MAKEVVAAAVATVIAFVAYLVSASLKFDVGVFISFCYLVCLANEG